MAQYLVQNCLNTGGADVIQGLSTNIINVSDGGSTTENQLNLNKTGGPNPEGGNIDFVSIPNAARGSIINVANALVLQSGDDVALSNGSITIPTLFIQTGTLLGSTTKILGNADANVLVSFRINSDNVALVQNTTNQLEQNKTLFTYPFQAGLPAEIRFQSELFKTGMVFLKNINGQGDIVGATMELDLIQDPPILTIQNIPFDGAGNCSAMLLVI